MEQKVSKYIIIENDIIESIKRGELKPGDKVDSESVLKKKYGVSAITVRKAFNDLINEGYLYGVQGLGTFVTKKQMIRGLTSISFSEELLQQGYKIDMIIDSVEEVTNKDIAEILHVDSDSTLVCVKRVRLANNEAIAYHTSYISTEKLSLEQAQTIKTTRSLYKTFAKYNLIPTWVNENYSVKEITDINVLNQLSLKKGCPSFFVKRMTYDSMDEIIEYAETYFNKDWYSVTVNIKA
ncbi:MAG: GntR family transcriptional regulator [Anaerorhabdus sp.]|uniref:GntR family transcriptional regulator n=1 Tax=Anaerorhabdus sp. TaxID=1872524 RepID=UPI003A87C4C2